MAGVLDIEFTLESRFVRLGYYYNQEGLKGHCFHYTKPTTESLSKGYNRVFKRAGNEGVVGSWRDKRVIGTYLHTFFRLYPEIFENIIE
jgi:cobyrinic acid a,c-diamide synthase